MVDWDEQPLGQVPDVVIAEKLGVSHASVWRARKRRGIEPCRAHSKARKRSDFNWDEQPLGELPDAVLAERLGVDGNAVKYQRVKRKIPLYYKPIRCPVCGEMLMVRGKGDISSKILRALVLSEHVRAAHQSIVEAIEENEGRDA